MVKFFFRSRFLNTICVLLLMTAATVNSQNRISGTVLSAEDSTAIIGASIYFDGTSIGVSSNQDGDFDISFMDNNSALIITSLGYEALVLDASEILKNPVDSKYYLPFKREELETVYLETDPWSRSRKLRHFRKEFLGRNYAIYNCKIINEDAIKLRYSPSEKTMKATAIEPLIIHNEYLGYAISYRLADFELGFQMNGGLLLPYSTYFAGSAYFQPLEKKISRKVLRNRDRSYYGSSLHFMRSLYKHKLEENNFAIYYKRFQVPTYKFFNISEEGKSQKIELLTDELSILYDKTEQSAIVSKNAFTIDQFGNPSPPEAILLKGIMSEKRISELLPLDYKIN